VVYPIQGVSLQRNVNIDATFKLSIAPRLLCPAGFNFGIPPAKSPPSWGGPLPAAIDDVAGGASARFRPPPTEDFGVSTAGALRSCVSAFFSFFPAWICFSRSLEAIGSTSTASGLAAWPNKSQVEPCLFV